MAVSDLIGDTVAKKNFYMDPCGRIKSPDEYAYYIKGSSILDGKPLAKTGDEPITYIEDMFEDIPCFPS
ncbi:MAG: hypothetical protein IKO84_02635 [Butyrivibrio sp.]|nr:hypothetical protein [Butyrivibrio sp.]